MLKKIRSFGTISLLLTGMLLGIILVLSIPFVWAKDNDKNILQRLQELEQWKAQLEKGITVTPDGNLQMVNLKDFVLVDQKTGLVSTRNITCPNEEGLQISVGSGGSIKHSFKYNGNVGIGTTNPQEKLEVNGAIQAYNLNLRNCKIYPNKFEYNNFKCELTIEMPDNRFIHFGSVNGFFAIASSTGSNSTHFYIFGCYK